MRKAAQIRLVVLDVDGVLTDGTFVLHQAEDETKAFHARDGFGIRLLKEAGIAVAFLTGRRSSVVERRGKELGIDAVVQGTGRKAEAFEELCKGLGVAPEAAAYMGDDVVDVPAMRRAGFAASPADAHAEAKRASDWVAASAGGHGAVRELCERILGDQGRLEGALERHLR